MRCVSRGGHVRNLSSLIPRPLANGSGMFVSQITLVVGYLLYFKRSL